MTARVHPTALVAPGAELGSDVEVGPLAVIGPDVVVGAGTSVGARATVEGPTRLGARCRVGVGAVLGCAPQDRRFDGATGAVEIGDDTVLREYVTVHRATVPGGTTRVGAEGYLMAYVHVAHDCVLGDQVTIANAVQLAGHVRIDDGATIGGLTPVHQFVRIGTLAFVGGGSRVPQDIPPYARAAGNPLKFYGVNTVGLRRAGAADERLRNLQRAFRLLFNSALSRADAHAAVQNEFGHVPEVAELLDFIAASERGVLA
jgi:UDP-N-acetylglucosamine acyltransferase